MGRTSYGGGVVSDIEQLQSLTKARASAAGVDPVLACAIVDQESSWDQWAWRCPSAHGEIQRERGFGMRRLLFLLIVLAAPALFGQVSNPGVRYVATPPSGTCAPAPPIQIIDGTGVIWGCVNPGSGYVWTALTSGGGGGGGSPTGPAGGVLSGTYPNPGLNASGVTLPNGSTATTQTAGDTTNKVANDAFVAAAIGSGSTITPEQIGNIYYLDGFPSSCTVATGPAAGTYTHQYDCMLAQMQALITSTGNSYTVIAGAKTYTACAQINWPVNTTTGGVLSIVGQGGTEYAPGTTISQSTSCTALTQPMVYIPGSPTTPPNPKFEDVAFLANNYAPVIMGIFGFTDLKISRVYGKGETGAAWTGAPTPTGLSSPLTGGFLFGAGGGPFGNGGYQITINNIEAGMSVANQANLAAGYLTISGGTVTAATLFQTCDTTGAQSTIGTGSSPCTGNTTAGQGYRHTPLALVTSPLCSVEPVITPTIANSGTLGNMYVTGLTVTSGGTCATAATGTTTVGLWLADMPAGAYGIYLGAGNATLTDVQMNHGATSCIRTGATVVWVHAHPITCPIGIIDDSISSVWVAPDLDTNFGIDYEATQGLAQTRLVNPASESYPNNGLGDYNYGHVGFYTTSTTPKVQITGPTCQETSNQGSSNYDYYSSAGPLSTFTNAQTFAVSQDVVCLETGRTPYDRILNAPVIPVDGAAISIGSSNSGNSVYMAFQGNSPTGPRSILGWYSGANGLYIGGGSGHPLLLGSNNASLGLGTGAILDSSSNFGIGTNTSAASSDPIYFPAAGNGMSIGLGLTAQNTSINLDNGRTFVGYDFTNNNALLQGGTGRGAALSYGSSTFPGTYGLLLDSTGSVGIGTATSAASSDSWFVTSAGSQTAHTVTSVVSVTTNHLIGSGTAPTIAAGAGAGTSPTIALDGSAHDSAFTVQLTTGTTPSASSTIATVTFGTAFGTTPHCSLSSNATYPAGTQITKTQTTSAMTITVNTVALAAATTYGWDVVCIQ